MLSDYIMIINKDNIRYESIISNHFETHCDEFANIFANILFVGWHYKIDDIYIDILNNYLKLEIPYNTNVYDTLNLIYNNIALYICKNHKNNKLLTFEYMDSIEHIKYATTEILTNTNRNAISEYINLYVEKNNLFYLLNKLKNIDMKHSNDIEIMSINVYNILKDCKIVRDSVTDMVYYLIDYKYINIGKKNVDELIQKILNNYDQKGGIFMNKYLKYKHKYKKLLFDQKI